MMNAITMFTSGLNAGSLPGGIWSGSDERLDEAEAAVVLATQTDGRAIVNRNDIAVGMKQITRDSSAYYLIGYNSSQAPALTANSTKSKCA